MDCLEACLLFQEGCLLQVGPVLNWWRAVVAHRMDFAVVDFPVGESLSRQMGRQVFEMVDVG